MDITHAVFSAGTCFRFYVGAASSAHEAAPSTCCHHSPVREGLGGSDCTETKREGYIRKGESQ